MNHHLEKLCDDLREQNARYEYIQSVKNKCVENYLSAPESFNFVPVSLMSKIYNGCGPEWMSKFTRKALTFALRVFEPAIMIHDYRFEFSDGTKESFKLANDEFYANCKKLAKAAYNWYNPLRYKWLWRAFVAWRFCVRGGWSAWIEAFEKNNPKKEIETMNDEPKKAQDISLSKGEVSTVINQDPKPAANKVYHAGLLIVNGEKRFALFTEYELERALARAEKNPEDCPDEAFFSKYLGL